MKLLSKYYLEVIVFLLYLVSLSFIYPFSITHFGGDSNQYYGWIKDIYANHYDYTSWTTAAGYNQFSVIHIFSFLIGSITYKNPVAFFLIANYTELILLLITTLAFIKLSGIENNKYRIWLFILPPSIAVWTIMSLLASPSTEETLIIATDLYLMFVDTLIILSIGLFINILSNYQKQQKIPLTKFLIFIAITIYFTVTTLRYINGAILSEIMLLAIFFIRSIKIAKLSKKPLKNSPSINCILSNPKAIYLIGTILLLIAILGYYGFFMLEVYSTSARFVLRGGEVSTAIALTNASNAITQYFGSFTDQLTIILRVIYLLILPYGLYSLVKQTIKPSVLTLQQIFAILSVGNFVLVTLAGLFSHGTVFLDTGVIAHYYELSAIFAFLVICALVVNLIEIYNYRILSVITLSITAVIGIVYSISNPKKFPESEIISCINTNKAQYNLHDGLGDWSLKDVASAHPDNSLRYNLIAARATNLDYNWQSNLELKNQDTNFLAYNNNTYKQTALAMINSKIPNINYQEIRCNDNSGILVFDATTTQYINKFRKTEYENAKSWFYLTNYGTGQALWAKMPWNSSYIKDHHEYNYFGSLFGRTNNSVQYTVNPDLSITVNGNGGQSPILASEMIHAGAGKYYINLNYVTDSGAAIFVVNLSTNQPIANATLASNNKTANFDFILDQPTPIALVILMAPNSNSYTLESITFGKYR